MSLTLSCISNGVRLACVCEVAFLESKVSNLKSVSSSLKCQI